MTGRNRGIGVDDEGDQFRVLFRTFLRGLFENDLVPATVDLRQSALWLAAVFMIPPAVFALVLSLSYGSWMTDDELALRAVPQKLYFIGYSMAVVGFVTVLVWDRLFPDRRDAIMLGSLPIRPRNIVVARLAALVAVVVGFAIAVNLPGTVLFSLVAGSYLPFEAFLRYPVAHFIATTAAGLLVFLALAALQACIALVLPERLLRRVPLLAQLLFVIVLIEWLAFAPGLLARLAAIDPDATSEALAAADGPYQFVGLTTSRVGIWLPPVWFLGLYEVIWGFDPEAFRRLAGTGVLALAATLSIATLACGAVFRRVVRHALETPPDAPRRTGPVSRAATRLAHATLLRHPLEQAIVAFAARSLARSRLHRLLAAAYVGLGLAFVVGSFLMTEIDDKAAYLNGSRKAMWLLGALPIAGVTFPVYAVWWGPVTALEHTAFWLLMSGCLTELLLCRFHKVPFACSYVPGKANLKYLWPVYALALTAYAWWTARLELWLLAEPVRWSVGSGTLLTCLALAIAFRRRTPGLSKPLVYEEEVEGAVQVLGVMRT